MHIEVHIVSLVDFSNDLIQNRRGIIKNNKINNIYLYVKKIIILMRQCNTNIHNNWVFFGCRSNNVYQDVIVKAK